MPMETRSKRKSSNVTESAPSKSTKRSRTDLRHSAEEAHKLRASTTSALAIHDSTGTSEEAPQQPQASPAQATRRRGRATRHRAAQPQQPSSCAAPDTEAPSLAPALPSDSQQAAGRGEGAEAPAAANPPDQGAMANRPAKGNQEEDQDPGGHPFGRDFSSASSALQGLLRKLGAGFEDMLPGVLGMGGSKVKAIVTGLRSFDDESQQLSSLTELCEFLSIASEDALASFPLETVVPLLVQLLNMEHHPDIMLLAARAMTFMADALPTSCGVIARHGAIPVFCARLLTIEYIDLAEQSLQALEKLSHEYSHVLLQHGGLLAVLSFLDFFPTGVQRIAVSTAANMCRGLSTDNAEAVKAAVPILTSLLQYSDSKVVDHACIALSYIAEAFSSNPELLAQLSSGGLMTQIMQLINISDSGGMTSQLSLGTYFSLIKLLTTCVRGSSAVAQTLLHAGILDTLCQLLTTSSMLSSGGGPATSSVVRSVDQLHDVVLLLSALLPTAPDAPTALLQGLPLTDADPASKGSPTCERVIFFTENLPLLNRFSSHLLPLLLQVHATTVMSQVRQTCLGAISKVLYASPADMLEENLRELSVSNFIAGLLMGRDTSAAAFAMQMAEVLIGKLPNVYRPLFLKEGVLHAMEQLASTPAPAAPSAAAEEPRHPAAGPSQPSSVEAGDKAPRVTRSSSRLREQEKEGKDKGKDRTKEKEAKEKEAKEKGDSEPKEKDTRQKRSPGVVSVEAPKAAPAKLSLKEALALRAGEFKQVHYATGCNSALETEGLVLIRSLCQRLPQADHQLLSTLFEALSGNNISVFELLNSGAVQNLLSFILGEDLKQQQQPNSSSNHNSSAARQDRALLERTQLFVKVALPDGSRNSPAMATLVRKLQAALSSLDTLPVLSARFGPSPSSRLTGLGGFANRFPSGGSAPARSNAGKGSAGSLSSGLAMLTQPLKLRLCRHSAERNLEEYSSNIVMIEPLATMSAIEDFLYPRVLRSASSQEQGAAAAAAAAAAAVAAAGKKAEAAAAAAAEAAEPPKAHGSKATTDITKAQDGNAAGAAGASGRAGGSCPAAASKAQMIPEPSHRRVTRSQAARSEADKGATKPASTRQRRRNDVTGLTHKAEAQHHTDEEMQDAAEVAVGLGDVPAPGGLSAAMDDADTHKDDAFDHAHEDDEEGQPIFDEEDEEDEDGGSFDDMDDGGDADMDIQPMHVHDLHVEESMPSGTEPHADAEAGSSAAQQAAAGRASGRITSSMAATKAGPSSGPVATAAAKSASDRTSGPTAGAAAEPPAARPTAAAVVGQEGPKLVFYIGGQRLPSGTTVFQAVQQQYIASVGTAAGDAGEDQDDEAGDAPGAGGTRDPSQPQRRSRRLWEEIHTLSYRKTSDIPPEELTAEAAEVGGSAQSSSGSDATSAGRWSASPLTEILSPSKLQSLSAGQACKDVLHLLQLLEAINRLGGRIAMTAQPAASVQAAGATCKARQVEGDDVPGRMPREEFVNQKLGSKLGQQLKDVLSICGGSMPPWVAMLVGSCKFLFPFEMRRRYFYCTAFGLGRALHHMQQLNAAESGGAAGVDPGRELRVGRLQRQKVRVSRKRILESAIKVMDLYAKQRTVLEIEYFGEVGTGLGPTLEFFTLLSHDLQKRSLGLWRHEDNVQANAMDIDESADARPAPRSGVAPAALVPRGAEVWHEASEYVNAPWGLFPAPLPESQRSSSRVVDHFRLLGRTVAKALQDCRLMDLPLSYAFYKAVLGKRVDLLDIATFDPQLGHTLERMQASLAQHQVSHTTTSPPPLTVDGVPLADLCLTFTLPGYPDLELTPGGSDVDVTDANLGEYIDAVVDATLGSGIESQLKAFREGFNEVFPLSTLECFYEDEVETLLCGSGEHWTVHSLADSIKFDHGYTGSSPVIKCFLEVLSELDAADQRRFLRFVTGCPRLPPGGIAALQPQLTVVRKHPSTDTTPPGGTPVGSFKDNSGVGTTAADGDLPSVMTCANYIKLPPYSSKEILKQRLMYAISEGQGSFDLS